MFSHNIKSSDDFRRSLLNTKGTLYACTIRHNPKYKKDLRPKKVPYSNDEKREIYEVVLSHLINSYGAKIQHIAYELKGGLHLHCSIVFEKVPYFKELKYKDIHFKFVKMYYTAGWASYCDKEPILKAIQQMRDTVKYYTSSSTSMFSPP